MPLKNKLKMGNPLKNSKHEIKSPWGDLSKLVGKKAKKH